MLVLVIVIGLALQLRLQIVRVIIPPPAYPNYDSQEAIIDEAMHLSNGLEQHIEAWLSGDGPAEIPPELLPDGRQPGITNYRLVDPDDVTPEDVWLVRPSAPLNPEALAAAFPDPHATYAIIPAFYLPFD
ncbi:MAG: hypothetical protein AAF787_19935, partial [Chloroflexota bacterium]